MERKNISEMEKDTTKLWNVTNAENDEGSKGQKITLEKSKIKKNSELRGKSNRKVPNHMANSNERTHQKQMDKYCPIPDLVQAFQM